jgi:hypothetical protein
MAPLAMPIMGCSSRIHFAVQREVALKTQGIRICTNPNAKLECRQPQPQLLSHISSKPGGSEKSRKLAAYATPGPAQQLSSELVSDV